MRQLNGLAAGPAAGLVWLLLSIPSTAVANDNPGPSYSLSLEEAVARALEANEGIIIERRGANIAAAGEVAARGAYDPVLGLDAGWNESTTPVNSAFSGAPEGSLAPTSEGVDAGATLSRLFGSGGLVALRARASRVDSNGSFGLLAPAYDAQIGVEFRQPLWRDRSIDPARLGLRVAATDRDRAAASLRLEVRDTVAGVEQAYWALVAALRAIEVEREAIELAEEQLGETRIRVESGAAPEAEVAQPRAELERRRGNLLQAQETAARAENRLKLLVLSDAETDLWAQTLLPADDIEIEPAGVDLAASMERALSSRAELDDAQAVLDRRAIEAEFAGDRIHPSLDAVVSYDRFGLAGDLNPAGGGIPGLPGEAPSEFVGDFGDAWSGIGDGDFDDTRVGLVFEVPLGNRTAEANAEIASYAQEQAAAHLARARKNIRAEVLDAAASLETAGARIGATGAALEAAEVQLESEQERFDVGLSTNFLVLTRQNDLSSARLNHIRALVDYRAARVEMDRATGDLLAGRGIEIDDNQAETDHV